MDCLNLPVSGIKCPRCESEAIYRFGRDQLGRQRFRCLICDRQFVIFKSRHEIKEHPVCSKCGRKMHLYRRYSGMLRFRCSGYPRCRTYIKIKVEEE